MAKKVYIKTYGCQMNVYDSDRMTGVLAPLGYATTESAQDADLVILNTCHIREKAEQKVYSELGRMNMIKQEKKEAGIDYTIAVAGCVAQAEGDEILRQAPYVSMVFGPQSYHQLPEMIAQLERSKDCKKGPGRGIVNVDFPIEAKFDALPMPEKTTSCAFLSIQEGCDKFCKFCVVPYTRGAEYSRPVEKILKEARHLVELGAKEITLLGQNVNAYHGEHTDGIWSLARLLEVLSAFDGLERIRYTTSHPRDVTDDLILAHADLPKVMPFIHLPVQSGSNKILKDMNRKHDRDFYFDIIDRFRAKRPDITFSSDFIVGYPGETEEDFLQTMDLVERVQYGQAYSFMYSPRPGTPAAAMELQVPEDVKAERLQRLQNLIMDQQLTFNQSFVDKIELVLFDRIGNRPGQIIGKTPYMQSVPIEAPARLVGQILPVKILSVTASSLKGEIQTGEFETQQSA
ncbi:MAG: tRNA-2-methylthio-N(6)-dimethylallyladenosine synthase [Holosporales bacterium]